MATMSEIKVRGNIRKLRDAQAQHDIDGIDTLAGGSDNLMDPLASRWVQGNQYEIILDKKFPVRLEPIYLAAFFKSGWNESASGGICVRIYNSINTEIGSYWFYKHYTEPKTINIKTQYPEAEYFKITVNTNVGSIRIYPGNLNDLIEGYVGYRALAALDDAKPLYMGENDISRWNRAVTDNLFCKAEDFWTYGNYSSASLKYCVTSKRNFTAQNKMLYVAVRHTQYWRGGTGGVVIRIFNSSDELLGSQWCYDNWVNKINIVSEYPTASYFKIEVNTNDGLKYIYPSWVGSEIDCYVGYTEIINALSILPQTAVQADIYQNQRLDQLEKNTMDSFIPSFYKEYMEERIATVNNLDTAVGNHGDAFIFITDMHNENNYYSPAMASRIMKNSSVRMVVYGGDYMNELGTKADAIESLTSRRNKCLTAERAVMIRGNHDTNPYGGSGAQLTADEYYGICDKPVETWIDTERNTYFCRDNEIQKIRYFFLDCGTDGTVDNTQQTWFSEKLAELNSSWHVVVFMHYGIYPAVEKERDAIETYGCLTTIKGLLTGISAKVCCVISGHVHIDISDTTGDYPIIGVTCDAHGAQASGSSNDDRTEGTVNEQAFDVFHIDTTAKKIYTTRFGGGEYNVTTGNDLTLNDREFTYT